MSSKGETLLEKHLSGRRLTRNQAILAKCADCMNCYVDGRQDCKATRCPLYPFAPYRDQPAASNSPAKARKRIAQSDCGAEVGADKESAHD